LPTAHFIIAPKHTPTHTRLPHRHTQTLTKTRIAPSPCQFLRDRQSLASSSQHPAAEQGLLTPQPPSPQQQQPEEEEHTAPGKVMRRSSSGGSFCWCVRVCLHVCVIVSFVCEAQGSLGKHNAAMCVRRFWRGHSTCYSLCGVLTTSSLTSGGAIWSIR